MQATEALTRTKKQVAEARRRHAEERMPERVSELERTNTQRREAHLAHMREAALRAETDDFREQRLDTLRTTQAELQSRIEQLETAIEWSKQVETIKRLSEGRTSLGSMTDANLSMLQAMKSLQVSQEVQSAHRTEGTGREHLNKREWEAAAKAFETAAQHYAAGQALCEDSEPGRGRELEECKERCDKAVSLADAQRRADTAAETARNLVTQGKVAQALSQLEVARGALDVLTEGLRPQPMGTPLLDLGRQVRRWRSEVDMLRAIIVEDIAAAKGQH
mmetsp:Transcript_47489/g.103146  ORF Transcript_47489/g.103146 Transcript_47489/m.103146 type:complete len:278 (+) Transcript_47489:13-846(+)